MAALSSSGHRITAENGFPQKVRLRVNGHRITTYRYHLARTTLAGSVTTLNGVRNLPVSHAEPAPCERESNYVTALAQQ